MGVTLAQWDDEAAVQVFRALDPYDWIEAELARGGTQGALGLFADWRMLNSMRFLSRLAYCQRDGKPVPFAVVGVNETGQAGVAEAALLARRHVYFRRELAQLGLMVRREMPGLCARVGVRRIEARSWAGHPTAGAFLRACGFQHEAIMPGFGQRGRDVFNLFAWVATNEEKDHVSDEETTGADRASAAGNRAA